MVCHSEGNMETIGTEINKNNTNIYFLLLIGLLIICMMVLIVILVKNKNAIMNDPIHYGMTENGFYNCVCYSDTKKVEFDNITAKITYLYNISQDYKIYFDDNES
jgi:hypothetical protein